GLSVLRRPFEDCFTVGDFFGKISVEGEMLWNLGNVDQRKFAPSVTSGDRDRQINRACVLLTSKNRHHNSAVQGFTSSNCQKKTRTWRTRVSMPLWSSVGNTL